MLLVLLLLLLLFVLLLLLLLLLLSRQQQHHRCSSSSSGSSGSSSSRKSLGVLLFFLFLFLVFDCEFYFFTSPQRAPGFSLGAHLPRNRGGPQAFCREGPPGGPLNNKMPGVPSFLGPLPELFLGDPFLRLAVQLQPWRRALSGPPCGPPFHSSWPPDYTLAGGPLWSPSLRVTPLGVSSPAEGPFRGPLRGTLGAPGDTRSIVGGRALPPTKFTGSLLVVETLQAAAEACESLLHASQRDSNSSNTSSNNNISSNTSSNNISSSNNNMSSNNSSTTSRGSFQGPPREEEKEVFVLGYDTEHDPVPRGGPGAAPPTPLRVLQLGAPGVVAVFLLGPLGGLPECVAAILKDPKIIKVTQGAPLEARKLHAEFGISVEGFFCLFLASSFLSRSFSASRGPAAVLGAPGGPWSCSGAPHGWHGGGPRGGLSLRALCALYLKEALDKRQQQSNWGGPLTREQLLYAATDADVSRRVYLAIKDSLGPQKMGALKRIMGAPYNGGGGASRSEGPPLATIMEAHREIQPHP